jgi:hypothetical protein
VTLEVLEYTAPAHWASLAVNGDDSGMEDDDAAAANAWLASLPGPVVSVSEEGEGPGFLRWHDAAAFMPLAADCATFTILINKD